jgi:uncharacterized protein
MSLLIDGYNLLHASGILPRGIGPGTLERARGALLSFLVVSLEPEEVRRTTVVFDARQAPRGLPRAIGHEGLRVRFAPQSSDADELIEELIRADSTPRKLIVVSGDHRLHRAARRRRATPIDSDVWYAQVLERRIARQKKPAGDLPKPAGPLTAGEVSFWLVKFGMAPLDRETGDRQPDVQQSGDSPAADPRSFQDPLLRNPFPPGYGEDLLQDD